MNKFSRRFISLTLFITVSLSVNAQYKSTTRPTPEKTAVFQWKQFDVNNINATINSAGPYADYLRTNSGGLIWPKGTNKTAVYTAGIWVIGKHQPTNKLRTAIMDYTTEFQPGPILTTFNTTTNDSSVASDPNVSKHRIYKIRTGDNAAKNIDYAEWPGELGAPYIDANKNGVWDSGIDRPKLTGHQTLWNVYNDAHAKWHRASGATDPMGIEIQVTYFGYDDIQYLKNVMFMKWQIINKSDAAYDSVYISLWSDIDLGDSNDDVAACDTSLSLSYVYNGDNLDEGGNGYGNLPPSCGFQLIQGPLVPGLPSDTGYFDVRQIAGKKNLPASSHSVYFSGNPMYSDPPLGNIAFAQRAYNYQQGLIGETGAPYINSQTNLPSKFVFSGDPVSNTGWTQSSSGILPGDVRSMISSGPFTMAKGDTQEIVGAFLIAQGTDRINSIVQLRDIAALLPNKYRSEYRIIPVPRLKAYSDSIVQKTDSSVTVIVKAMLTQKKDSDKVMMKFSHGDGSPIATVPLLDDGANDDGSAGDSLYGIRYTAPMKESGVKGELVITKMNESPEVYSSILNVHPLRAAKLHSYNIVFDALNQDGLINPKEPTTLSFLLKNLTPWNWKNLRIDFLLSPGITYSDPFGPIRYKNILPYDSTSAGTGVITFSTLNNIEKDSLYTLYYQVTDTAYNATWFDSITVPVTPYKPVDRLIHRSLGVGTGAFGITMTDPTKLKNNQYTVDVTFGIKMFLVNRTSGMALLRNYPFYFGTSYNDTIPLIEGFKLSKGTFPVQCNIPLGAFETKGVSGASIPDRWPDQVPTDPGLGVYRRPNSTQTWTVGTLLSDGQSGTLNDLTTPTNDSLGYDYEFRFTAAGSEYYVGGHVDSMTVKASDKVPFELWRIRHYGTPEDIKEQRLVIHIQDLDRNMHWTGTADSLTSEPLFGTLPNGEYAEPLASTVPAGPLKAALRSLNLYRPSGFQNFNAPSAGTVIRIVTSQTPRVGDSYAFNPMKLLGIQRIEDRIPSTFELFQNYPNPFNPSTTIRYSVPVSSAVKISVFNVLGQRIATIADQVHEAGNYSVVWNGRNDRQQPVSSGIYFYWLETDGLRLSKKMLIIK